MTTPDRRRPALTAVLALHSPTWPTSPAHPTHTTAWPCRPPRAATRTRHTPHVYTHATRAQLASLPLSQPYTAHINKKCKVCVPVTQVGHSTAASRVIGMTKKPHQPLNVRSVSWIPKPHPRHHPRRHPRHRHWPPQWHPVGGRPRRPFHCPRRYSHLLPCSSSSCWLGIFFCAQTPTRDAQTVGLDQPALHAARALPGVSTLGGKHGLAGHEPPATSTIVAAHFRKSLMVFCKRSRKTSTSCWVMPIPAAAVM